MDSLPPPYTHTLLQMLTTVCGTCQTPAGARLGLRGLQTKQGISALELSRRLDVSYNTAWALHHKLRQVMERNQEKPLDGRIEMAAARAAVHEEEHQENHRADRALARARELAVEAEEGERLE